MLNREWKFPWEVVELLKDIRSNEEQIDLQVKHINREGNALADYIANLATDNISKLSFHSFQKLPSKERKIFNIEKAQIPSLRIRS